jgi:DMSO/TMAO reductase YedYZ molybdopterin-dependent catalytic subunit
MTTRTRASEVAVGLELGGAVERPLSLGVGDLCARFAPHRADVVFDCLTSGARRHRFEGPMLRDVVTAARPVFGAGGRKERSRCRLAVSGADGHGAVLAWAEIDADFRDVPVLLATSQDGRTLTRGPQLVVPSDRCGARYVSAVTCVRVMRYAAS